MEVNCWSRLETMRKLPTLAFPSLTLLYPPPPGTHRIPEAQVQHDRASSTTTRRFTNEHELAKPSNNALPPMHPTMARCTHPAPTPRPYTSQERANYVDEETPHTHTHTLRRECDYHPENAAPMSLIESPVPQCFARNVCLPMNTHGSNAGPILRGGARQPEGGGEATPRVSESLFADMRSSGCEDLTNSVRAYDRDSEAKCAMHPPGRRARVEPSGAVASSGCPDLITHDNATCADTTRRGGMTVLCATS